MTIQQTPYTDAVAELAEAFARRPFRDAITTDDAKVHVDADVVRAWFADELSRQSGPSLLGEIVSEALTDAECLGFVASAMSAHKADAGAQLEQALRERVARELAYDAERAVENMEPADDEGARVSFPAWVDDPMREDQTAMARHVNAALRIAGLMR